MNDLNRKVCEKLGWTLKPLAKHNGFTVAQTTIWISPNGEEWHIADDNLPEDYTTDLNALFRDVVGKMEGMMLDKLIKDEDRYNNGRWICCVYIKSEELIDLYAEGVAPTPAEAICRAFLEMEDE